jgi:hypothetical protein
MPESQKMRKTTEQRFWEKVDKNGPVPMHRPDLGPCWIWLAAKNEKGYGIFWDGTKLIRAHNFTYNLHIGKILEGLVPDHLCKFTSCVNPYHLEPVTSLENCKRGGGAWAIHRGDFCTRGHSLTGDNLGRNKIRGEYHRECLRCRKLRRDRWRKLHPDWRTRGRKV